MEPKEEIKQRLTVEDVIKDYLDLRPAGSGSFKACCPFHSEKTPSFYLSLPKEIWHCFGCDKGGDIYAFVMEIEGVGFGEALRKLGKKAGVEIPDFRSSKESAKETFQRDLNELACKYYEKVVMHEQGKVAADYITSRNIDKDLAATFRLGAAPDAWDSLTKHLHKQGFKDERIIEAGLAKKTSSGHKLIDRFRNRVMIPLKDQSGRVVGFTARRLAPESEKSGPKYLNSPETEIYQKRKVIYGLSLAKVAIRSQQNVIIVEGNLDVIASHKAGVKNVVASSGTALTDEQLKQLKKFTNTISFCFDGDAAGFKAATRGIHAAQALDIEVQVIRIPPEAGKDPDDVVQKDPEIWVKVTSEPIPIMEYYFENALKGFDPSNVKAKRHVGHQLLSEIKRLKDPIERDHWISRLSDVLQVDASVLRPIIQTGPKFKAAPKKNVVQVQPPDIKTGPAPLPDTAEHRAASITIGIMLKGIDIQTDSLPNPSLFPEGDLQKIYKIVQESYTQANLSGSTQNDIYSQVLKELTNQGGENAEDRLRPIFMKAERLFNGLKSDQVRAELNRQIALLRSAETKKQRKHMEMAIREAERSGNKDRLRELMEAYTKMLS